MGVFMSYFLSRFTRWPQCFKLLYLLMVFDGMATYFGLQLKLISEGNPVMAAGFNAYPVLTLGLKLVLSLLFLEVLCVAIYYKKLKWPQHSIPIFLFIHLAVALMHLHWISLSLG